MISPGTDAFKEVLTSMMWLHSLACHNVESLSRKVELVASCGDGSLNLGSWPENVSHGSPWVVVVGTKQAQSVLSNLESRAGLANLEVDNSVVSSLGHDLVGFFVFGKLNGEVIGVEGELFIVESLVEKLGGRPVSSSIWVEDFDDKLGVDLDLPVRSRMH